MISSRSGVHGMIGVEVLGSCSVRCRTTLIINTGSKTRPLSAEYPGDRGSVSRLRQRTEADETRGFQRTSRLTGGRSRNSPTLWQHEHSTSLFKKNSEEEPFMKAQRHYRPGHAIQLGVQLCSVQNTVALVL